MDFNNLTKEALPKEFQDRIERFNRLFIEATGKSFEEADLYEYEMGCIRQALSFNEYFKDFSDEDFDAFTKEHESLYDLVMAVKDKLPFFDDGHSGNSLGMSWQLYYCYRTRPDLIPYMHGCLANLVGDVGYHDDRSDLPELE